MNPGRLVHDNLIVGGPDAPKNKLDTHYKTEFKRKANADIKPDKEQFEINRDYVRNAKPVNTQYPIKIKDTEYKRQYVPLRGSSNICPINKLP